MDTNRKGDIGEAKILVELLDKGYEVYTPFSDHSRCDFIIERDRKFERIQCKYTESDGEVIKVRHYSVVNGGLRKHYTKDDIEWLIVYDATSNRCYYVPPEKFNKCGIIHLRLKPTKNNQQKYINYAEDFTKF